MSGYEPVKLAFEVFQPRTKADEALSPIIFIHGLSQSRTAWENIPQRIADATKRKAFTYDARNHGESEYTKNFSFDLNVDDLFYFMDTNSISRAILIGHSMGGKTAIHAALKKPERIEKVFVEDMVVKKFTQETIDQGLPLLYLRKESTLHMPKSLTMQEAMNFSNDFVIDKIPKDSPLQERKDEIRKGKLNIKKNANGAWEVNYNFDALINALKNAETLSSEPRGQYTGPTYFLYGSLSPLSVQKEEEEIRNHFPNAELIEIVGATHSIHSDFEDEFVENILNRI